ncbi:acyl carrier protein [Rhizobium sp. P32RR-XVIII]|uniref:acyl carrier protein n=1 Tax=Rhizobium sp. P32RR-XVIII TaxID=2726738 RepID=UPI001456399B|nr:acyl carrier protein [Rhizobium sp. P32RR-XVIII]NLS05968.1 acyl carrier protein [Rhizobium sp. P32RR-XVIII]
MTNDQILASLTEIFRDILDDEDLQLTLQSTAADIQDWDSANHINIIVSAEMRFKIKFNSAEIERLKNVGDLVELTQKKLVSKA